MREHTSQQSSPPEISTSAHTGSAVDGPHAPSALDEAQLVAALRGGDEATFWELVTTHYPAMLRLALMYVSNRAVAEEVVQETWVGVLQGLSSFEARSSLKTWIFRILTNRAKTRALRERRSVPFSLLQDLKTEGDEPAVAPNRFLPPDHEQYPGEWVSFPHRWDEIPEERLLTQETREQVAQAITSLAPAQRAVITLRDVEGWSAEEVCDVLGITETNQRVLLHRARSKVCRALEEYFDEE